jgi:uncharacterized protein
MDLSRPFAAAFLLCLAALLPASAQELGRYEGQAMVASQSAGDRTAALPRALAQVLVKLTGDPQTASNPALQDALARAPELMQQYRYRQLDPTHAGGARLALIASFDRAAVDAMLAAAGQQAWPEPRPLPVVWLAIDDGRGPRLVGSAQAQAVAALTERARTRGLRLNYPLLDLEDQREIDASRVWNHDTAAVQAATRRYQSQVALAGRLSRTGNGWTAEWRVLDDGRALDQVRVSDPDAAVALAAGADLAADALARQHFAQLSDAGPAGRHTVGIEDVRGAQDYARVLGYLQQLALVRATTPVRALDRRLLLDLDLGTGIDGFARVVDAGGTLQALPPQPGERVRRFRLEP